MKNYFNSNLLVFCLLLGIGSFLLFKFMVRLIDDEHHNNQRMEVMQQLSHFRLRLEQQLNSPIYVSRGLAFSLANSSATLSEQRESIERWAEDAMVALPYLRNIGLSEGYIIRFTYPLQGNQSILGTDYRELPQQWPLIQKAIEEQQPVVAGPVDLVQGGVGVICRVPLFSQAANSDDSMFLGVVSLVLDYQELLQTTGLIDAEKTLEIAIRGRDGLGSGGAVFHGSDILFEEDGVAQSVIFFGGEWLLAARPNGGWDYQSPFSTLLIIACAVVSLLITVMTFYAVSGFQQRLAQAREFNQELERCVDDRTRELMLAKEEAESANRAKSDFLAVVTHELRTPLNSIIGLAHLLNEMELGKKQREYLAKVSTSASLLLGLINNVLSYSRIESGQDVVKQEAFSLIDLKQKIEDVFVENSRKKGLEFSINYEKEVPEYVKGDPDKVLQILVNLCGNAMKFTQQGNISLSVFLVDETVATYKLKFVVEDTGIGIASTELTQLFKPFSQVDSGHSRRFQGTGLGLSISKRFVELMKGTIGIDSELGRGSAFWFEIPFDKVTDMSSLNISSPKAEVKTTLELSKSVLQGRKIILAEDNEFNQTLSIALLEKVGMTVYLAETGLEVLELLEQQVVDGILMDIQMPGLDGISATEKIRQSAEFSDLPIIAITANTMAEDVERFYAAGMNAFVAKPIDVEQLYQVLCQFFDKSILDSEEIV